MVRFANGFYSFSDSYLKAMRKQDLINYIRTIEKNWENQLITNDIQYNNCKRLLAEERNKAIDEFAERLKNKLVLRYGNATVTEQYVAIQATDWCNEIAEQLKGGAE